MFALRLFRLVFGYVCFRAEGGFPERFINLCAQRGIDIRDVGIEQRVISAKIDARSYKKLRPIARASGMNLRVTEKKGLPFFLFRSRDRVGLAVGAVFFAVFVTAASLFVWNVDTCGSCAVSNEKLLQVAKELGVYPGAFLPRINPAFVNEQAMMKLSGKVSWVAVNIKGAEASVEVREYTERKQDETFGPPCNIVADFDGTLLTLEVFNGQKANFEGCGVKKGDLLISGIAENRDASSVFMEARGRATALHNDEITAVQGKDEKIGKYTKQKTVKFFRFFGITVPLGFFQRGGSYDEFYSESRLEYGKKELPFWIMRKTRLYYQEQTADVSAYLSFFDSFTSLAYNKYKQTNILSSKIQVKNENGRLSVFGYNKCIDFIGEKKLIDFG